MMSLKRTCLNACMNLPPVVRYQQMRKKRSFRSRKAVMTRSNLNLPSLTYQKIDSCDTENDINQMFTKLSALHCHLYDPLKEVLLWCACEDNEKDYKFSCFDPFTTKKQLPREVCCSPQPDHVPLTKRILSNKFANEQKSFDVYRQDAPLATIIARTSCVIYLSKKLEIVEQNRIPDTILQGIISFYTNKLYKR
ncbi:uncharacterized protein LOC128323643 isoform X2 [Hemicordylus capensis]|uniref:uncharacterized protein LOC128323643 isoform X2 n=1 Tax=Hemicordylus capensis TaxID=884348 RepID=UPI002302754B|nr:uncharacterized protein LOC128323643 isoform X2 [Hemicordylus capensis]